MHDYRGDFPDFAPTVYLDCAYQGPLPRVGIARIHEAIELKSHPERLSSSEHFDAPEHVRGQLAGLIGADPSEIALTNSATHGIGIVAAGLDLRAGDEVVVARANFPSNLFTWLHLRRRGVHLHLVLAVGGQVGLGGLPPGVRPPTPRFAL